MWRFKKPVDLSQFDDDGNPRPRNPVLLAKAKADTLATRRAALIGTATEDLNRSYLGGQPLLPEHLVWPTYDERPLVFVCQIDLSELPCTEEFLWLPLTGLLFYFVGQGGYEGIDYHIFRVIYSHEIPNEVRKSPPGGAEPYRQQNLAFDIKDTYRLCSNEVIQWEDDNELSDWGYEINHAIHRSTLWQFGGWVSDLQDEDMPLYCERQYRNLDWNDYATVHRMFASSLPKWRFMGCVNREGVDVPAAGYKRGYFWIKDFEAMRGDFSRAAFVVQSD